MDVYWKGALTNYRITAGASGAITLTVRAGDGHGNVSETVLPLQFNEWARLLANMRAYLDDVDSYGG